MEASTQDGSERLHASNQGNRGASTPRDLVTRLKLLELYTLHILPRNEEWDYAKDFITISEVLDDERREAFLLALHNLREERDHANMKDVERRRQQQEQIEQKRRDAQNRAETARRKMDERPTRSIGNGENVNRAPVIHHPNKTTVRPTDTSGPSPRKPRPAKKPIERQQGLYRKASFVFQGLQNAIVRSARSIAKNPTSLVRMVLFLIAFILTMARRDVRERLKQVVGTSLIKLRQTVGMGVKVSYI
jgi:hypothetical protein